VSGKNICRINKIRANDSSATKRAIMGQIHSVNIPSLCPVGRLSPVNGREPNKKGHPALNLSPVYGGKRSSREAERWMKAGLGVIKNSMKINYIFLRTVMKDFSESFDMYALLQTILNIFSETSKLQKHLQIKL